MRPIETRIEEPSDEPESLPIDQAEEIQVKKVPDELNKKRGSREKAPNEQEFLPLDQIVAMHPAKAAEYVSSLTESEQDLFFTQVVNAVETGAPELLAYMSYWQKWLEKDQSKLLDKVIKEKKEIYKPNSDSLPLELEKRFSDEELKIIFRNTETIQLTFGCSKGCAFCGFDAIPGAREHIPYSQLANMFERYGGSLSKGKPFLYWASEPSDYKFEDKTYQDVHELAKRYANYQPHITSRETQDEGWIGYINKEGDARLSGLNLGEGALKKLSKTIESVEEKNGSRISLKLLGIGVDDKGDFYAGKALPMGIDFYQKEKEESEGLPKAGIACKDGILLTPRGVYNMFVLPMTKEYPQGSIIIPFEKLTDQEIAVGDHLKDVMRTAIIEGQFSGSIASTKESIKAGHLISTVNFPRTKKLYTKNRQYEVKVSKDGVIEEIIDVKEVPVPGLED